MPEYMINGIPVKFPYEPYRVQTVYMEKVIECLKQGVNGMLESPTGTGKTLCLLCASLSWLAMKKAQIQASRDEHLQATCDVLLKDLQNQPGTSTAFWSSSVPKIIYASRTHSQLTQVIQELKKSGYGHIKVTVLGSRDQLCIHPEVSQSPDYILKINKCQVLTKSKNCFFHNNLEKKIESNPDFMGNAIMDIEDLVTVGQRKKVCPYFLAREMRVNADITFIPYNYILDRKRMQTQSISLEGSVIILDEAHNIERICEESASFDITSTEIALCINEITQVMEHIHKNNELGFVDSEDTQLDVPPEHLCLLKTIFLELEKAVDDIELKSEALTFSGSYIVELLAKVKITEENYTTLVAMLVSVVQFLSVTGSSPLQSKGAALYKVIDLLDIVYKTSIDFSLHLKRLQKNFKVHITHEEIRSSKPSDSWNRTQSTVTKTKGKVISFMCFTPSYGLKELLRQGARCVIFTSGTLSPLPALISELDVPISVTLVNPHVINTGQVSVSVIKKGPDGYVLNSSFKTRDDPKYISSLGNTVLNVCRIVPHGLLVFFPSYALMHNCKDAWQKSGIWSSICKFKPIFVEPRKIDMLPQVMKGYYDAIQNPETRGACFMAVTRGKVSEGLDFMDSNGRAVIVTGLPYPPLMDPYVKLKKEYLTENCKEKDSNSVTPDQWYLFEATRAVNQAIGRVIRHKNDYGAIILCDSRFGSNYIKKSLSSWIQSQIKAYETFGPVIRDLRKFFVNAEQTLPAPRVSGPTVAVKLPTAVGASFDEVTGRSSKSATTEVSLKEVLLASDMILEEYASSNQERRSKRGTSPECKKKIDLFEALEKSAHVIDFNNMMAASSSKSLFRCSKTDEPAIKTKKLRVAPPNIMPLSQESEAMFSGECSSGALSKKSSTSNAAVPSCSKQAEDSGNPNNTQISSHTAASGNSRKYLLKESKAMFSGECSSGALSKKSSTSNAAVPSCSKQAEDSGNPNNTQISSHTAASGNSRKYLLKVKSSLDHCSYHKFKVMCFEYEKTKNFKELLAALEDIMLKKGRNLTTLVREFRCFVQSRHREEFDEYLKKIPDY